MAQSRKDKQPEGAPARRGRAAPLGDDAGRAGQTALVKAGFADPRLVLRWEEIAGPETARLARPLRLSGEVLTLRTEPGAAVFLQHEVRPLLERINTFLGSPTINRLRFVQGALAPPPAKPSRPPARKPVLPTDPARNYQGPEGLRDALLRLAQARRPAINAAQD